MEAIMEFPPTEEVLDRLEPGAIMMTKPWSKKKITLKHRHFLSLMELSNENNGEDGIKGNFLGKQRK